MLNLHHQIVNNIDLTVTKTRYSGHDIVKDNIEFLGRDVFEKRYYDFYQLLKDQKQNFEKIYSNSYNVVNSDFGHYFRNLYRIVKLIDETIFTQDKDEDYKIKYKYTSIIRAQLSNFELAWIFYNCITNYGKDKFKPLIEKYTLLKNLPKEIVFEEHIKLYNDSAFNKQKISS